MNSLIINSKKEYWYTVDDVKKMTNMHVGLPTCIKRGKKPIIYYNISCAFDIETTNINGEKPYAFMYHWQFCFNNEIVIFGVTWDEYKSLVTYLKKELNLSDSKRLVVYVHNLPFEFEFLWSHFNFTEIFAREKRKVIKAYADGIEYRCSYALSNMSLAKFCENSENVTHYKLTGTYDYKKIRTPSTKATPHELKYDYNDVKGLTECIAYKLKDDTIATIPLTSTGYVRRDFRTAMFSNKKNRDLINRLSVNDKIYIMLKEAFRGGNTHANAMYTNKTIEKVKSRDLASSYPTSMLIDKYPMSPFIDANTCDFDKYLVEGYALLFRARYTNIFYIGESGIPYIPLSKCLDCQEYLNDNGRIIDATTLIITLTDIDYIIIKDTYIYESLEICDLYISKYGYLPSEYREKIVDYYKAKTQLKNVKGKEYEYMKSKNRLNSAYGMMVTDPCNDLILFVDGEWKKEKCNISEKLEEHNISKSTFLAYQWGVWVTANARMRLENMLDIVGKDVVYTDTDSIKYINDHDLEFENANQDIIKKGIESGITTFAVRNGVRYYMGIWDKDGEYNFFKTLGAKKYIAVKHGKAEVTVAGLNKSLASLYINKLAKRKKVNPCDLFYIGQKFNRSSGRTSAHYNDVNSYVINLDDESILTGSNVAILDTTYILGVTDTYLEFFGNVQNNVDNSEKQVYNKRKNNKIKERKNENKKSGNL